ncbi:diaminopimelate epimerase [Luteococcus sp.]|uniref:diaminopimelate epimerase n=1 Tax=Luteococcus sp. TaxID=1969402 RepID=UPI0037350903
MRTWKFAKGHGTQNDFVIVTDRHGMVRLDDDDVRFLCDRRAGIGGDGLLRVTMASSIEDHEDEPERWFMDYRNADGSIAEMCGNGLRVFVRYLLEEGLVSGREIEVMTRAGLRRAWPQHDGTIRTLLGEVRLGDEPVQVSRGEGRWAATTVDVGNPHAVCFVDGADELSALDLTHEPVWEPAQAFPEGTNIEFVHVIDEHHIAMRVHERGAGETMSCGTGTVAAAAAHARRAGLGGGEVVVDVPGGRLVVELDGSQAYLTGPAVVVGRGEVVMPD